MDSKRLRILKAFTTLFESISVDEDYLHNLAEKVFRGRTIFGHSDEPPLVSILENPKPQFSDDQSGESKKKTKQDWQLLIQGFSLDDKTNPTDPAHHLLADVKTALGKIKLEDDENYLLGGLITDFFTDGGLVRPPDENSEKALFYLRLSVRFVEDETDPYQ